MYRRRSDGRFAVNLPINGRRRTVYLGRDRQQAKELYDRTVAEWLASPSALRPARSRLEDLSVAEVANTYLDYAEKKYRKRDGTEKTELVSIKSVLLILSRLYGTLSATEFDQHKLEALRAEMVRSGGSKRAWCRKTINDAVVRIKRMFRWAASRRLIPSSVPADLATVGGLRAGESDAAESRVVSPVDLAHVQALKPHLGRQVWAMVQVQLFSGARPGEVCSMRGCELDMSSTEWLYVPTEHKTAHRGHRRVIVLGPKAQHALAPFLSDDPNQFLFRPKDARAEANARRHAQRKTPLSCGNRPGSNVVQNPKRPPGERYSVSSYRRAIHLACDKAGLPRFNPGQLRHLAADRAARVDGAEGARCLLGHRSVSVTAVYMSRDEERARKIVRCIG